MRVVAFFTVLYVHSRPLCKHPRTYIGFGSGALKGVLFTSMADVFYKEKLKRAAGVFVCVVDVIFLLNWRLFTQTLEDQRSFADTVKNTNYSSDLSGVLGQATIGVNDDVLFWTSFGIVMLLGLWSNFNSDGSRMRGIIYLIINTIFIVVIGMTHQKAVSDLKCSKLNINTSATALFDSTEYDECEYFNQCEKDAPQLRFRHTQLYYHLPTLYLPLGVAFLSSIFITSGNVNGNSNNPLAAKIGSRTPSQQITESIRSLIF